MSSDRVLPRGWSVRPNGDVWEGVGGSARAVVYRVRDGWLVPGVRSAGELRAIADWVEGHDGERGR